MSRVCQESDKKRYLKRIVESLHMNMDDFNDALRRNLNYEVYINSWANNFYLKGIPPIKAVQEINRKLIFISINS